MPVTPAPSAETLRLMRQVVAPELAEVYPQFAAKVFGVGKIAPETANCGRRVGMVVMPAHRARRPNQTEDIP